MKEKELLKKMNAVSLKRRQAFYIPTYGMNPDNINHSPELIFSFMENISKLGFTLTEKTIKALWSFDENVLSDLLPDLIDDVRVIVGADVVYEPMYPGFPNQVRDMSSSELYLNAIVHYISGGTLFPDYTGKYEIIENVPLPYNELKKIDLIDSDEFKSIFMNLIGSKTSISADDVNDLKFYFKELYTAGTELPEFNFKENLAVVANLYIQYVEELTPEDLVSWFKTATDVLRLYVGMSDGDVSLATPTKFRNLKHREQKFIMKLLNQIKFLDEDMFRYKEYWKRAGEKIHPNTFSSKTFGDVQMAFFRLRQNLKPETWMSQAMAYINASDWENAINFLAKRPGELARRLDFLLRKSDKPDLVVELFKNTATDLTVPVLLQIYKHFETRYSPKEYRVFLPKGSAAKAFSKKVSEDDLGFINPKYVIAIYKFAYNAIIAKLGQKEFMGNVFLDESFKGFLVPFSQRSASATSRPCVRGSRWKLKDNTKFIRSFIWWKNGEMDRIDIDSSISFYDGKFKRLTYISYGRLSDTKLQCYHSGDIIDGGPMDDHGAAEFIDINIDKAMDAGAKYAVFEVHLFTGADSFAENFPCRAGYMEIPEEPYYEYGTKDKSKQKAVFEVMDSARVQMKMDLNSDTRHAIPIVIDLETREVIWTDLVGSVDVIRPINNTQATANRTTMYLYSILHLNRVSLYELIQMNIAARGIQTDNKEDADVVFSIDEGITPFELDRFMSEFM